MPPRDSSAPGPGGCLRSLLALALLGAWTALLASALLSPSEAGVPRLSELRSLEAARASLGRAALGCALTALRFAPLGLFAVFVFRDRGFRIARAVLVALPALVLGGAAAVAALWLRDRAAGLPGPSDLLLPPGRRRARRPRRARGAPRRLRARAPAR